MEELLKAVSWQHLAFIFALFFIFTFRQPLSDLIRRVTSISKDGLTAGTPPEAQREHDHESAQQLLDIIGSSIVIEELENRIKSDLTAKNLSTEGSSVKVLTRHLAGTQLLLSFEQIHNFIFGSQIFLLKKLNEVTGQGRHISFVHEHINHIRRIYPGELQEWSNEEYLSFLTLRSLIIQHDEQVHITNLGVEYLTWIARNGRSEDKPL